MKKYRKRKKSRKKPISQKRLTNRKLRSGSKEVKRILHAQKPYCDICGSSKSLQLHHIYLIRHGFPTKLEHCSLLCESCHREFHHRFDKYLDITYNECREADFGAIYQVLKKL